MNPILLVLVLVLVLETKRTNRGRGRERGGERRDGSWVVRQTPRALPRSSNTSDVCRVRMHPRRAVGALQETIGLFIANHLSLCRVPVQTTAEFHRKIRQNTRGRGD